MIENLTPEHLDMMIRRSHPRSVSEPLIVFDIDSTIMHTGYRNRRILDEAVLRWPTLAPFAENLGADDLGWNIVGLIEGRGCTDQDLLVSLQSFWEDRFFHDDYLTADRPYPQVREFIEKLIQLAYSIVYLTGRDAPGMERGTRASFAAHGIPEARFIFKPDKEIPDLLFKTDAMQEIQEIGTVVAAVENEPANANRFKEFFPRAEVLLLDSITSPDPETPRKDLCRFKTYALD